MIRWLIALDSVVRRDTLRFFKQTSRLVSAIVRPALWLLVFAAGFQNVLGVSITPPYETYIPYDVYMAPGLLGMVLLFQGMQSSLSLVFDREVGLLRLLLTSPFPRAYLLFVKLVAGTILGVLQAIVFLGVARLAGVDIPNSAFITVIPALVIGGFTLASLGLLLSVYVKRLENYAGAMNFVIFPSFFFSTALYPLWKISESGAFWIVYIAQLNPFTSVVEMIRFAMYGQIAWRSVLITFLVGTVAFMIAARGYDPQRGVLGRKSQE